MRALKHLYIGSQNNHETKILQVKVKYPGRQIKLYTDVNETQTHPGFLYNA